MKNNEFIYKPGDRVVVRKDLNTYQCYKMKKKGKEIDASLHMLRYCGDVVTIETCKSNGFYEVVETYGNWTDEMFTGFEVKNKVDEQEIIVLGDQTRNFGINIQVQKIIYRESTTIIFYNVEGDTKVRKVKAQCGQEEFNKEKGVEVCMLKAMRKELSRRLRKM